MKVAITGHTRGIGLALATVFQNNNHEVIGFSRSNGYDIETATQTIIEQAQGVDVFINNAYHPTGQTELLKALLELDTLIVNMSSKCIMYPTENQNPIIQSYQEVYKAAKLEQQNIISPLLADRRYKILNVIPGMVNSGYPQILAPERVKISTQDIAELLYNIILSRDKFYIQEIVLDPPYQNVSD
jgi:NADP-dependent 3-hydroxy acid dehydrogenase YdfG